MHGSLKVRDIHQFLVEIDLRIPTASCGIDGPVTYHESCHLKNGQGVSEPPRQILSAIPGLQIEDPQQERLVAPLASWLDQRPR